MDKNKRFPRSAPTGNSALPEDLIARIAAALEPILPPALRIRHMRETLLAAAATSAPQAVSGVRPEAARSPAPRARQHMTLRADEGRWLQLAEGIRIKPLHREHSTLSYLLEMGAGHFIPEHDHAEDEECLVLEGDVWLGDTHAFAGDFHLARQGIPHGRIYTESGCLLYLRGTRPEMPRVVR